MMRPRRHTLSRYASSAVLVIAPFVTCSEPTRTVTATATLLEEHFEDAALATRGWYDNTGVLLSAVEHAPGSTKSAEFRFVAGATVPTSGLAMRHKFSASTTLYVSYWVKYSENWVGSTKAYGPHEFLVLSTLDGDYDGPSNNWLTLYIEHNYRAEGGFPKLGLQDNKAINSSHGTPPIDLRGVTESRSTAGCNGVVEQDVVTACFDVPPWYNGKEINASAPAFLPASGANYKAQWNHVEAWFQLNSIANSVGVGDGVMQYWLNGALKIDRHDILFRTAARADVRFSQFLIAPYMGDGSPISQSMFVDDLIIASERPERRR